MRNAKLHKYLTFYVQQIVQHEVNATVIRWRCEKNVLNINFLQLIIDKVEK